MNRHEQYLRQTKPAEKAPGIPTHTREGYPILTAREAYDRAGELPGLCPGPRELLIKHRRDWIMQTCAEYYASTPNGLSVFHA